MLICSVFRLLLLLLLRQHYENLCSRYDVDCTPSTVAHGARATRLHAGITPTWNNITPDSLANSAALR